MRAINVIGGATPFTFVYSTLIVIGDASLMHFLWRRRRVR